MNRDVDTLIGRLAPVTDERAGLLLSEETAAGLADRITATVPGPDPVPGPAAGPRRRRPVLVTVGLPLATAAAAAAAVTVLVARDEPGTPGPPVSTQVSPKVRLAAALAFTDRGDHIDVRVRDPLADPERYRAEFEARGLDVRLSLVPGSPSLVGTLVMLGTSEGTRDDDVTAITAKGECETGGGGDQCPVGVRIRTDYKGSAEIVFARAARPGEQYNSAAPVTAPGEVMHGMTFRNHRVGAVLDALKKRNVTVPEYRAMYGNESRDLRPEQVPPTWYVHDATPWAKNQVLMFVGPAPSK
ncbi:hypothetical protein E1287_14975 [Actinomadura sp. KC06]|uniref:hypothetical protein n=1 Tax=Actinomadura sp. KC06 TaxID=2530369 RepID=UPI00104E8AB8|nr:hypothetical protein [Actinomadura sp. KC06]TDD35074.1 hypothetical protein E1287_14975 [Actinomadura sp. KC06]